MVCWSGYKSWTVKVSWFDYLIFSYDYWTYMICAAPFVCPSMIATLGCNWPCFLVLLNNSTILYGLFYLFFLRLWRTVAMIICWCEEIPFSFVSRKLSRIFKFSTKKWNIVVQILILFCQKLHVKKIFLWALIKEGDN